MVGCLLAACSGGDSDALRSFRLTGEQGGGTPTEVPDPPSPWRRLEAVVVDAPVTVTAGEDFEVVIELRNPLSEAPIDFEPCPSWTGGFGHETEYIDLTGSLPCEDIDRLEPGERIRLELTIPAPSTVDVNEGGEYPNLDWRLVGEYFARTRTEVAIPMREPT
jgi:hypothetical protein